MTPWAMIAAAVLLLAACGSGSAEPEQTATTFADPADTATASSETPRPTATAMPSATPTTAAESPTESVLPSELEEIVDIILTGDASALRGASVLQPTPCSEDPLIHSWSLKCPEGVADGTEIPYLRATACEIVLEEESSDNFQGFVENKRILYAIFEETGEEEYNPWIPRGTFAVVVRRPLPDRDRGAAFQVADGQIVGIRFGCGSSPEEYLEGVEESQVLVGPIID